MPTPSRSVRLAGALASLALAHPALPQTTLYVNPAAPPGGDGGSWTTALNDLQDALDTAVAIPDPAGYLLRLAGGRYTPDDAADLFEMPHNITILGGHTTVGDQRDPDLFPTIISGDILGDDDPDDPGTLVDNASLLIRYVDPGTPPAPILLEGITLRDVRGVSGLSTALRANSDAPITILNCIVGPNHDANGVLMTASQANVSESLFIDNGLTGLNCGADLLTIDTCRFEANARALSLRPGDGSAVTNCSIEANAKGMVVFTDSPNEFTIRASTVSHNGGSSITRGAGVEFTSAGPASLVIEDCQFLDNIVGTPDAPSGNGAGVYAGSGFVRATDSRFEGNRASFGAALSGLNAVWTLERCTLESNHARTIAAMLVGTLTATDCLVRGNESNGLIYTQSTADLTATDIVGNTIGDAASPGPAIQSGALTLDGCTVAGNEQAGALCASITAGNTLFDSNAGRAIEAGSAILTDCTITGHSIQTGDGGAVLLGSDAPSALTRCAFTDNHTLDGSAGAVAARTHPESCTITDCTFDANSASDFAGALAGSRITATGCTFTANSAHTAGAFDARGECTVRDSTFLDNHADHNAGALLSPDNVVRCAFEGNTAGADAGAIYADDFSIRITSSTLRNNLAANEGGALWTASTTHVTNSIIAGNDALAGAGIYKSDFHALTLTSSTVYANAPSSTDPGAGLFLNDATGTTITNAIIWANADTSANVAERQIRANTPIFPRHSIIQGFADDADDALSAADPLFLDPLGPDLTPGTPDDDLRLLAQSPAIDAGDDGALPPDTHDLDDDDDTDEPLPLDLAGAPRIIDSPFSPAVAVDLGPYEFTADCTGLPDCDGDALRDDCAIAAGLASDCNDNAVPDTCDIDSGLSDDCNADQRPDECQTIARYALDDLLETKLPTFAYAPDVPADFGFLVMGQYTVRPGAETINAVEFYAGSTEETQVVVLVYDDPDNDADPADAVPIAAAVPTRPQQEPPIKRTVLIPPTHVGEPGDSFFVAVYFRIFGTRFAFPVESACAPDREFVSLDIGPLDDALDLSDDLFQPAVAISPLHFDCANQPGDFKPPLSLLIRPTLLAHHDCNDDSVPDACGPTPPPDANNDAVPDPCQCIADLDGNGRADVFDFSRLLANLPTPDGATLIHGDLDADHDVDLNDVTIFTRRFGQACRTSP